jgi:hypothetical protein
MAQMTDPLAALTSFQAVFETEGIPLQPGVIDPGSFIWIVRTDHPDSLMFGSTVAR